MTHEEFTAAVHAISEYSAMINMLSKERELLSEEVKVYMSENDITEADVDGLLVRASHITARKFSSKAFKAQYPELYTKFVKQTNYIRLSVKNQFAEENNDQ